MKKLFPVLLLVTACGSQPLEQREYLLRPAAHVVPSSSGDVVRLAGVRIAPYLDRKGIVLQTGTMEIHTGRQHRWAEPLDEAIARYLQVAIGSHAGVTVEMTPLTTPGDYPEIEVRIHQLHGSATGDVRLSAEWTLSSAGTHGIHAFDGSVRQEEDGYPALVQAHAALLDEFARAIAGSLTAG